MQSKRTLSSAVICAILIIALAVVPMLTLTAFAEENGAVKLYGPAGTYYQLEDGKLPEVTDVPDGYTFSGWSTTKIDKDTTTKPTILAAGTAVTSGTYYTVFSKTKSETKPGETVYQKTDIANIKSSDVVVITMAKGTTVYAISNDKGTSSAPTAVKVTVSGNNLSGNIADTILWNISNSSGTLTIYPDGTTQKWLYCTSSNNGVRVGTNTAKTFKINGNYLQHIGTSRYVGVYTTNPDFRCYTTNTGSSNIAGQTLAFYVKTTTAATTVETTYYYGGNICMHANEVESEPVGGKVTVSCGDCGAVLGTIDYCAHDNTATELVTPTTLYAGYERVTCVDCGEEQSYTVLDATCAHEYKTVTLAGSGSASVCALCGHTKDRIAGASGQSFTTDASFTSGRFYIATKRSSGNYIYMTNSLGTASTKRYQTYNSGSTTLPSIITNPDADKVFVIERNSDGTYKISAEGVSGNNYLFHSSGNSGDYSSTGLSLKITQKSAGVYNVHYTASDAERYLALNGNTGNEYFAFYKSGQAQDLTFIPVGSPYPSLSGAQASIGEDLGIKFGLNIPEGVDASKISLKITSGHDNVKVFDEIVKGTDGVSYILYDGIAPQCISDAICAELYYGEELVDVIGRYSFSDYLRKAWMDNQDDEKLAQLIADLLAYGKAAQAYVGHEEVITDEDIASYGTALKSAPTADDNVKSISGDKTSSVAFSAVGVRFSTVNSIYVSIKGATANTTVEVGGKVYTADKSGDVKIYLDPTSVLDFGTAITIELCEDGEVRQTLVYSIDSYSYSMINKATASDEMKALALALYNYGKSAAEYVK